MSDPHHPGPRDDPHGPDAQQSAGYETWPGDQAPAQLPAAQGRRTLLIAIVAGAVLVVAVAVTLVVVLTRSGRATTPGGAPIRRSPGPWPRTSTPSTLVTSAGSRP